MIAIVAIAGIVLTIIIVISCIIFHRKRTSLNQSIYGVIIHVLFKFLLIGVHSSQIKINKYVDISKIILSYHL